MERSDAQPGNNILKGNGVDCAELPNDVLIQAVKDRCANGTNDGAVLARELSVRLQAAEREKARAEEYKRYWKELRTTFRAQPPNLLISLRMALEVMDEIVNREECEQVEAIVREGE